MGKKRDKKKRKLAKLPFPTTTQKLQELSEQIDRHGKEIDAISHSHALQLSLLSNFVGHDLKNYIHSIDGIVSTHSADELTDEHIKTIKYNLQLMRDTLKDFSKLVVHDDKGCSLSELVEAVKISNRAIFAAQKIDFVVDKALQQINFKIPFVSMFQLINNLVINAIKATDGLAKKQIILQTQLDDTTLTLMLLDNGAPVAKDIQHKIFNYGFSASGGSGIGLFHAKYLCNIYKGHIQYHQVGALKGFLIRLPIIQEES